MIDKIKILGHERIIDKTFFDIQVILDNEEIKLIARYSQLEKVHRKFKKQNKNNRVPIFPPKKLFGSDNPIFLDQRANAIDAYFSTLLKFEKKLKYDMSSYVEFFKANKIIEENKKERMNSNISELTDNIPLTENLSFKEEQNEKNHTEKIFLNFTKSLVKIDNLLLLPSEERKNNFALQIENQQQKQFEDKMEIILREDLLQNLQEFCNHCDELFVNEEESFQKIFDDDLIYTFKQLKFCLLIIQFKIMFVIKIFLVFLMVLQKLKANCNKESGLILEISNDIFLQFKQALQKAIDEEIILKNLSHAINKLLQDKLDFREGNKKQFFFDQLYISSLKLKKLGINDNNEIEIYIEDIKIEISGEFIFQYRVYYYFGNFINIKGKIKQLPIDIRSVYISFNFQEFNEDYKIPLIKIKNSEFYLDLTNFLSFKQYIEFDSYTLSAISSFVGSSTLHWVVDNVIGLYQYFQKSSSNQKLQNEAKNQNLYEFIYLTLESNLMSTLISNIDIKITNLVNAAIIENYPLDVLIQEISTNQQEVNNKIFINTQLICEPKFGGQKNKRLRFYLNGEVFKEEHLQSQLQNSPNQIEQDLYSNNISTTFIRLLLSEKSFEKVLKFYFENHLIQLIKDAITYADQPAVGQANYRLLRNLRNRI